VHFLLETEIRFLEVMGSFFDLPFEFVTCPLDGLPSLSPVGDVLDLDRELIDLPIAVSQSTHREDCEQQLTVGTLKPHIGRISGESPVYRPVKDGPFRQGIVGMCQLRPGGSD
jgi:hypothetical protein